MAIKEKASGFFESAITWGGIGVILGAIGAAVSLKILFIIGAIPLACALIRADFFEGLDTWKKIVGDAVLCILLLGVLLVAWKITPKPKEPPTVDDIANAVKKKLDEKQNVQTGAPSAPIESKPTAQPKPATKPKAPLTAHKSATGNETPMHAHLSVSQSYKISTRPDAPVEAEVVVQTDTIFPSLKFVLQCDKPLIDAQPMIGGTATMAQMGVSRGIVQDHPNVVVYSYGSSTPPFGPANPLIIDVWSKGQVTCNQVATF